MSKMKILFIILQIGLFFISCNEFNNPLSDLNQYDYSIDQVRKCFCPNAERKVKIFVKDDLIEDVINTTDETRLPENEWNQYKTIKGLFEEIAKVDTTYNNLIVTYDSDYNYPRFVSISPKPIKINDTLIVRIMDADISYSTDNYKKYK